VLAKQYFSTESFTAYSARLGSSALPVTVKWTWIRACAGVLCRRL